MGSPYPSKGFAGTASKSGPMYIVVSRWRPKPGNEQRFEEIGKTMRGLLRQQPGVQFVEAFRPDEGSPEVVAVHFYDDEDAYNRTVAAEDGFFAAKAREFGIEDAAEWLGSDRGSAL